MTALLDGPALRDSRWCARLLRAHPDWEAAIADLVAAPLDAQLLPPLCARLRGAAEYRDEAHLRSVVRQVRNHWLYALIERDLSGSADLAEVMAATSALAEFAIAESLRFLTRAAVSSFGTPFGEENGVAQDLLVIGMGKLGGGELNVSSDIDLIFVYGEDGQTVPDAPGQRSLSNHEFFIRLGRKLIGVLSDATADGFVFRVDMRLRPNGDAGPLAISLAMLEEYFVVQGRNWERFAWIKARIVSPAVLGVPEVASAAALDDIVRPFVYRRYLDFGAIEALRALHGQIRAEVGRRDAQRPERAHNVKLGRGGIREIEFIAQHFQLIRGGRDAELRSRATLDVLRHLVEQGLLEADVSARLVAAYTLLRNVEHRLQYLDDAQTHSLPSDADGQMRVAAMSARLTGSTDFAVLADRIAAEQAFVAEQFDEVFGAREQPGQSSPEVALWSAAACEAPVDAAAQAAAVENLRTLGYPDPEAALARLRALWNGSRVRTLAPSNRERLDALMPQAIALSARCCGTTHADVDPAVLLGRTADLLEAISGRGAYLAFLTEFPAAFARVARLLAASPWAARYLTRHPILLDELLDDSADAPPDWADVKAQLMDAMHNADGDTERQMDLLRETHHARTFQLLTQDLDGKLTVETLSDHLSALADLILAAALDACWRSLRGSSGAVASAPRFAVIAYGKLGGKELGYSSDLDLVFLYNASGEEDPAVLYARLGQRLITWLTTTTTAGGLFDIDMRLRPDGAAGLPVSSLDAWRQYESHSAWVWEHQALTRARFCAGDDALGAAFEDERRKLLMRPRDVATLRGEVAAMRKRMHDGHPNRSGDFDLKHDAGGMVDIEFCVQFLVLAYGHRHPELLDDAGNIALLHRAAAAGLIDAGLAASVADAYRALRRRQHALRLAEARYARVPPDQFATERAAVSALCAALGLEF